MRHRHLDHHRFTPAAIDDVISRGRWRDWADLRLAVLADPALLEKVERMARAMHAFSQSRYPLLEEWDQLSPERRAYQREDKA